jgi:hypothetical protein
MLASTRIAGIFLFGLLLLQPSSSFLEHKLFSSTATSRRELLSSATLPITPFHTSTLTKTRTILHERKKDGVTYDGADRGRYLFVFVLFICIWQFSIPPSFRRAKFCPPACVKVRTACSSTCVTFDEWTSDIVQYYRDGGGIQWDFSIDPKTLAENERFVQNLLGNK